MPEVRILSGPESGRSVALAAGSVLRIGRKLPPSPGGGGAVHDLEIDDPKLSRLHCEVLEVDGAWVLRDCGSSNGTYLNGKRVHERVLRPGDRVQAGGVDLELVLLDGDASPSGALVEEEGPPRPARRGGHPAARVSTPWPALAGGGGAALLAAGLLVWALRGKGTEAPSPETAVAARKEPPSRAAPPAQAGSRGEAPPPETSARPAEPSPAGAAPPPPAREAVEAHLAKGEYREALAFLDDLKLRGGGFDLEPLRREVIARALVDLDAAVRRAEGEMVAGRSDAARNRLEEISLKLPDELTGHGVSALERIQSLDTNLVEGRRVFEEGSVRVRVALGKLDFDGAEAALDEASRKNAAAGSQRLFLAPEDSLRKEIRSAAAAWKALVRGIESRARDGTEISFARPRSPEAGEEAPEAERLRVAGREGDDVLLGGPGGGAPAKKAALVSARSIFEADDASLISLVESATEGDSRIEALDGLASLVYHRWGPDRAKTLVGVFRGIPGDRKDAIRKRIDAAGDSWIPASFAAIGAAVERLEESSHADGRRWDALCSQLGRLLVEWRARPGWAGRRMAAQELFVKAKTQSLGHSEISQFFSASRASRMGNKLRLEYAFESESSAADFKRVTGTRLQVTGKALLIQGECRLFEGEPFEEELNVKVKVAAGGYNEAAPNIGVALFTSANDVLRDPARPPRSLLTFLGAAHGPEPRDHALFAVGYKAPVVSYGEKLVEKIYVTGRTDPLDLPASAVIFGRRGEPLHMDSRECPWASPSAGFTGPLHFEIAAGPEEISWKLNGKTLVSGPGPVLDRWLQGNARSGSVTLLASGTTVKLTSLEVEGRLRTEWLEERLEKKAVQAFKAIAPR